MTASSLVRHHQPQRLEVELPSQHGGVQERRPAGLRQPRKAPLQHLLDAFRHADLAWGQRRRPAPGLEQMTHHLLDEEGVAVGLRRGRCGRAPTAPRARPATRSARRRCARPGPSSDMPCSSRSRRRSASSSTSGWSAAVSPSRQVADDQQRRLVLSAQHVAEQLERRPVGPVEVVEHEQHRRAGARIAEQRRDRLEHQVAPRLGVVRSGALERVDRELGDQQRELGGARAGLDGVVGVADVVAQGLDDGLVGQQRLLRAAPVEDGAVGLRRRARARPPAASCRSRAGRRAGRSGAGPSGPCPTPPAARRARSCGR